MNRKADVLEIDPDVTGVGTSDARYGDQERKKKKPKTRAWQGKDKIESKAGRRSRRRDDVAPIPADDQVPKAPRLPKRQSALLIGFCGTGYSGMQFQPDVPRTIEGVLFDALIKAGAVSQDNADDPIKVNLARAARTDAGVHAAGNIVSMKVITEIPDVPDFVTCVNQLLPPEIRLWGSVRVQNSFNARIACDSRKYTYYFPSYVLLPPKPDSEFVQVSKLNGFDTNVWDHDFYKGHESSSKEEDLARKRAWRVGPSQITRLREIVSKFEGTHNFHNFTVGREFTDRSNQRHMKKIEVVDPVMYGNTEWISVLFHGQSFMLHQIVRVIVIFWLKLTMQQRKMMTALVMTCRTGTPSGIIDELYGPRTVMVPKMPSLGLLLEEPVFESYNGRMTLVNQELHPSDPGYRPPIDFDLYRDQIAKFKDDFIYKNMRQVEDQTGLFDAWIRTVDNYSGQDLLYFNPKGTIPEAAVIEKGVKRDDPFREKNKFNVTGFTTTAESKSKEKQLQEDEDEEEEPIDKRKLAEAEG